MKPPSPGQARLCAHPLTVDDVLRSVDANPEQGLSGDQAAARRLRYGHNELAEARPVPLWRRLLSQFSELVVWILIAAAVVSGLLGEWADTVAILAIVLLNGLLGFFQEERAEQALAALRKLSAPLAKVWRDGVLQTLPARELLPGDIVELDAGDNVPADVRLVRAWGFLVQEAALTGESAPVEKNPDVVLDPAAARGDRRNMAYMGTVAAAGKAAGVVVAIGMQTELGRIAGLLQRYQPEPTPLERRLAELGRVLIAVCLGMVGLIFALQLLRGGDALQVFLLAVSLAVAAVPEGLPAVVTVALALGLQRMVRRNALIRKLPSVETLGAVTVICSDKTGTLTRNEMTVREIWAGGRHYLVTGAGYVPRGAFYLAEPSGPAGKRVPAVESGSVGAVDPRQVPELGRALAIGLRCNNARVRPRGKGGTAGRSSATRPKGPCSWRR